MSLANLAAELIGDIHKSKSKYDDKIDEITKSFDDISTFKQQTDLTKTNSMVSSCKVQLRNLSAEVITRLHDFQVNVIAVGLETNDPAKQDAAIKALLKETKNLDATLVKLKELYKMSFKLLEVISENKSKSKDKQDIEYFKNMYSAVELMHKHAEHEINTWVDGIEKLYSAVFHKMLETPFVADRVPKEVEELKVRLKKIEKSEGTLAKVWRALH